MKKRSIILKTEEFIYPNQEERRKAESNFPRLDTFIFDYKHEIKAIHENGLSMYEASRQGNLYHWNICLQNRFGQLRLSYVNMLTHFERGLGDDFYQCKDGEHINYFQFLYYSEVLIYFFISSRDILAQLLNCYYRIDIPENKVGLKEGLIGKINNSKVQNALKVFNDEIKDFANLRNGFAHRFTPSQSDFRTVFAYDKGKTTLGIKGGDMLKPSEMVDSIGNAIESFAKLMKSLVKEMPSKENGSTR